MVTQIDTAVDRSRPWFRFDLRTLFAVMTAIAVGIAVAGLLHALDTQSPRQPALIAILVSLLAGPPTVAAMFFRPPVDDWVFMTAVPVYYSLCTYLICQLRARLLLAFMLGLHVGCGLSCFAVMRNLIW